MLRQIGWGVQNGPITMSGVLPDSFFANFVLIQEPCKKSFFDVTTTQMFIFILFVSAGVLFEGAFTLWVFLAATENKGKLEVNLPNNQWFVNCLYNSHKSLIGNHLDLLSK